MADIKFADWAKGIRSFRKNPMEYLEPYAVDIVYAILYRMAELQVPDTGQSRALIIKKFAEKFNKDLSVFEDELARFDAYGNEKDGLRSWNNDNASTVKVKKNKKSFTVINEVQIGEDSRPIFKQNNGVLKMNPNHPRGSNAPYIYHHIDRTVDFVNAGDFTDAGIDVIIENMEQFIAKEILHGRLV